MPEASQHDYDRCAVRVRLVVDDLGSGQADQHVDGPGKYHYFSGRDQGDCIDYERTLLGRRSLRLRLAGVLGDEPTLTVNPDYLRFVTHRFMNLHSAGYILTDLVALLLLRRGLTPLHCAAFRQGRATVLILAPPNTGKTLTTMLACMEFGTEFLAEDLAISDGRSLYAVPWTSTFRYYTELSRSRRADVVNAMQKYLPPLQLLPLSKVRPVGSFIATSQIVAESVITHVAILERGTEAVVPIDRATAGRKAINLNRYEFNYVKAPALVAYEFFNPALDLDGAALEERRLIRSVVANATESFVVRTPDATRYAPLILEHLAA